MLVFVILRWTSAAFCIVGECILVWIRLSTFTFEFEMVSRDIGKSQKLGQKSSKSKEENVINVGHSQFAT